MPADSHALELGVKECVEMALQNNQGLKAHESDITESAEGVNISRAGFFPSLKLRSNYTVLDKSDTFVFQRDLFGPGIPPEDVDFSAENRETYGLSLDIEQPLFTGGRLSHAFRKSQALNEEASHRFELQKRLLTFEVKRAFYNALREQMNRKTIEKMMAFKQERLRVLNERFAEGYVQEEDVLVMKSDLSSSELDLFRAKNQEEFSLNRIKRYIYSATKEPLTLSGEPANGYLTASLEDVQRVTLANSEDLKAGLARIKSANEEIDVTKGDLYPSVSLKGSYAAQKETNINRPEQWMFKAQLEWPIFEWGKTQSEIRQKEAIKNKRNYEQEELKKIVLLESEAAWRAVKNREKEIEFYQQRLVTAEYRLKRTMDRFAEGLIKFVDLIEMETEMIKAYNEYITSLNDLRISLAYLETTTSTPYEEWFGERDIYRPDFESLSSRINEMVENQRKRQSKKEDAPAQKTKTEESLEDPVVKNPVPLSPVLKNSKGSAETSYALQVCSTKMKEYAEKVKKDLKKKTGARGINILQDSPFFKVRIQGFTSRQEAADFAEKLGLKNTLIVKN